MDTYKRVDLSNEDMRKLQFIIQSYEEQGSEVPTSLKELINKKVSMMGGTEVSPITVKKYVTNITDNKAIIIYQIYRSVNVSFSNTIDRWSCSGKHHFNICL